MRAVESVVMNLVLLPFFVVLFCFLPGYCFARSLIRNSETLSMGARWFIPIAASVCLTTWLGLTLAEFGAFSLWGVAALDALWCAAVWFFARKRWGAWQLLPLQPDGIFLALLVLAVFLFAHPAEYIIGNSDAGTYINTGANIARTGAIAIYDAQVAQLPFDSAKAFYWQLINPFMLYHAVRLPGFFVADAAQGLVLPQFLQFYPVWLALWDSMLGVQWGLYATPLIALLGSIAFYFLARDLYVSLRAEREISAGADERFLASAARNDKGGGKRINSLLRDARAKNFAWLAFFLLIVCVPQFWFARYPVAEGMTQFLALTGIWALMRMPPTPPPSPMRRGEEDLTPSPSPMRRGENDLIIENLPPPSFAGKGVGGLGLFARGEIGLALLAGIALGEIFFTRADAILLLVPLALYFMICVFTRAWRREHWAFFGALGVVLGQAVLHMLVFAPNYLYYQYSHALRMKNIDKLLPGGLPTANELFARGEYLLLLAGALMAGVLALFVADRAAQWGRARFGGRMRAGWTRSEKWVRLIGAAVIVALIVFAYFVWAHPTSLYAYVGGETPLDRSANLIKLGWYLSPLGIALATLGAVIVALRDLNARNLFFFGTAGLFTLFYLEELYSNPHYIYTTRHYIPLVIPLFLLCAARALDWLWHEARAKNAARQRIARIAAGGAFALWMLYNAYAMGIVEASRANGVALRVPFVNQTIGLGALRIEPFANSIVGMNELGGAYEQIQRVADALNANAVIIFSAGRDEPAALATPLKYIFGRDAFVSVFNNPPGDKIAAMVDAWRAQGRDVILAYGTNGGRLQIPGYALERVGDASLDVPQWAFAYDFMPRSAWRVNLNYTLYRAVPRTAPDATPFVLDFGGDDFPYLMSGFLERAPEASTRWIGAIEPDAQKASAMKFVSGVVRVPMSASGALQVHVRARAPRDGARLILKSGDRKIKTFQLTPEFADYEAVVDASVLKRSGESVLLELSVEATPDGQGRVLGAELQRLQVQRVQ